MSKPAVKLWTKDFVFIILLVFLNRIMLLSTFPFYIQSLGGNEALAGLAATLFSLIAVVCRPFIGWMLDNGKRKAILVVGICGLILMPVGYMCVSVRSSSHSFANGTRGLLSLLQYIHQYHCHRYHSKTALCRGHGHVRHGYGTGDLLRSRFGGGIDIAKRKHEAAVIDGEGTVVIKPFSFINNCSGYNRLIGLLKKAKLPLEEVSFAMEPTGRYWLALFYSASEGGLPRLGYQSGAYQFYSQLLHSSGENGPTGRAAHRRGDPL